MENGEYVYINNGEVYKQNIFFSEMIKVNLTM